MKIAIVSNGAQSLVNFRGPLLMEMVRLGHEVFAFAPDHDDGSRDELRTMGVEPIDCKMARSGTDPLQEMASIVSLRRLLLKYQPDLCFSYFIKPVIYGTIAAWLAGVPRRYGLIEGLGFAFTEASDQNWRRQMLQKVISRLAKFALARLDRLIFLNPDDIEEFTSRGLVAKKKAFLLGAIGLDLVEWSAAPLPDGPLTFIMVARLLRDKGVYEYVRAARIVRQNYPDTRFLLVGGHDSNPAAIDLSDVYASVKEGLIEWPGHVDIKPWLKRGHIFVLPSYREGVPRSTQEAMALGRPVVTTDVPGCRETVIEGRNGFMVPAADHEALANAMQKFLGNLKMVEKMGKESRKMAEDLFDVRAQNKKLLSYLGMK